MAVEALWVSILSGGGLMLFPDDPSGVDRDVVRAWVLGLVEGAGLPADESGLACGVSVGG